MSSRMAYLVFAALYLVSFAALGGWFLLLFVGFFDDGVMKFANDIGVPTLIGSIICLEVFRRLAAHAEKRALSDG